jgi:hypothetical protein
LTQRIFEGVHHLIDIKVFYKSDIRAVNSATGMTTTSNFMSTFAAMAPLSASLLTALKVAIFSSDVFP